MRFKKRCCLLARLRAALLRQRVQLTDCFLLRPEKPLRFLLRIQSVAPEIRAFPSFEKADRPFHHPGRHALSLYENHRSDLPDSQVFGEESLHGLDGLLLGRALSRDRDFIALSDAQTHQPH